MDSPAGQNERLDPHYQRMANRVPPLSPDEEMALRMQYKATGDAKAKEALVAANFRYAVHLAQKYRSRVRGTSIHINDLVGCAQLGLAEAIEKDDPSRGVRLITYAAYWMKAEITLYLRDHRRAVRTETTNQARKFYQRGLNEKARIEHLVGFEKKESPSYHPEEVYVRLGKSLGITSERARRLDELVGQRELLLDHLSPGEENSALPFTDADRLPDAQVDLAREDARAKRLITDSLQTLDSRERYIIDRRWLCDKDDKQSLQEIGDNFGVTRERVRQIEERAKKRLRAFIEKREGY